MKVTSSEVISENKMAPNVTFMKRYGLMQSHASWKVTLWRTDKWRHWSGCRICDMTKYYIQLLVNERP